MILEGITPPSDTFDDFSRAMNEVGRELMRQCDEDAFCSTQMGEPAWTKLERTLSAVEERGHCSALGATRDDFFVPVFGTLLMQRPLRDLIPSLVRRLERCSDEDRAVWAHLYRTLFAGTGAADARLGPFHPLFFHVALSEQWPLAGAPDAEEAALEQDGLAMSTGLTLRIARRQGGWPTYPRPSPELYELPPDRGVPMLLMQGDLDPATPVDGARLLAAHYRSAHYVEFKDGAHSVSGDACGRAIAAEFLRRPTDAPDATCAETSESLQLEVPAAIAERYLGHPDAWPAP